MNKRFNQKCFMKIKYLQPPNSWYKPAIGKIRTFYKTSHQYYLYS